MSDLAVIEFSPDTIDAQLVQMREITAAIASCDNADEVVNAAERALQARKVIDALNGAEALRIEATRMALTALRRAGQMRIEAQLPTHLRGAAKTLAKIPADEFAGLVINASGQHGPAHIAREWFKQRNATESVDDFLTGRDTVTADERRTLAEVEDAARVLLGSLDLADKPASVAEMADKLAELLQLGHYDDLATSAIKAVIRDATVIDSSMGGSDTNYVVGVPRFITFEDMNRGWLRIPWMVASVEHLEAMAAYREEQARQVAAAATRMSRACELLRAIRDDVVRSDPSAVVTLGELAKPHRGLSVRERIAAHNRNLS